MNSKNEEIVKIQTTSKDFEDEPKLYEAEYDDVLKQMPVNSILRIISDMDATKDLWLVKKYEWPEPFKFSSRCRPIDLLFEEMELDGSHPLELASVLRFKCDFDTSYFAVHFRSMRELLREILDQRNLKIYFDPFMKNYLFDDVTQTVHISSPFGASIKPAKRQ